MGKGDGLEEGCKKQKPSPTVSPHPTLSWISQQELKCPQKSWLLTHSFGPPHAAQPPVALQSTGKEPPPRIARTASVPQGNPQPNPRPHWSQGRQHPDVGGRRGLQVKVGYPTPEAYGGEGSLVSLRMICHCLMRLMSPRGWYAVVPLGLSLEADAHGNDGEWLAGE